MPISPNSLIHFTNTKEALIGILRDAFKIKYCYECIKSHTKPKTLKYAIPMVSFCNIPLSQIKNHLESYGPYGIGLNLKWGQQKGLNPVIYLDVYSNITESIYELQRSTINNRKGSTVLTENQKQILDILCYAKNFEADLERRGHKKIKNYRFSDEREWRYIPLHPHKNSTYLIGGNTYNDDRPLYNSKVSNLILDFTPEDITYIIIRDESEIKEVIQELRYSKGKKYPLDEVERLITRIVTSEQIKTDF
ncbi:abortive infection system antitoxin AbiGi family protein [Xanthocytophaga agilis]|uniref:Abortive infection system antitoxin AbiGi family protein n=1 Tax=Xanthocytophaga agilis TaxID=3048010 RepID=A0AAE3R5E4_9BACT|nr:abortive infection system antitoxin AbiGi family protein [Xanthocytophaga agilis]MDJ1503540.1 abortive infection system antitoxin AbiGi family protein [Xanthocytophaga agilis]